MKVEIISNGKVRLFFSAETAMDEAALADLGKQPVELIVINKQVSILDKSFSSGVILQTKVRDTSTHDEPSTMHELAAKTMNSKSVIEDRGPGSGAQIGGSRLDD